MPRPRSACKSKEGAPRAPPETAIRKGERYVFELADGVGVAVPGVPAGAVVDV